MIGRIQRKAEGGAVMEKNLFTGKYFVGGVDDKVHFEIQVKMFLPEDEPPDKDHSAACIDTGLTQECENFVESIIANESILEGLDYLGGTEEEYIDLSMDTEVWTTEYEKIKLVDK
jgi:hypothetical protein